MSNALQTTPLTRPRLAGRAFGKPAAPGALVVGGDYQGLSIVRSLGSRGIPVCVVDDETSIARFSKYTSKAISLPGLRQEHSAVEAVLRVSSELGLDGWVLYPTRDEHVAAFSRHRQRLSSILRVPTPEWDCIRWAWDKRNTYQRADALGIPTPRTFYPKTLDDLKRIDFPPPYAIKPAIKEHFIYSTHAKAWRANNADELELLCRQAAQILTVDEIMVQEIVPGGGANQVSYCAFRRDGVAVGKMVACRKRQHPLEFGRASTFVESMDLPVVEHHSESFLNSIDYYGLVEVEYKCDPRDGRYKLLDVNARTWGYLSLGARAGVDFSYMLYADQLGLPVQTCSAKPGVSWMRLTTDLPTALLGCWVGEINIAGYLRSLWSCNVEAVFSMTDPLPGLAEMSLLPYLVLRKGF
ncbi:MAG TPA: ATP-grasp domain-containing protein [Verrucomicrobiae bacterium]|nr:ATP-grasp domain-containing protein [Verrucomicrobiae bacterium]